MNLVDPAAFQAALGMLFSDASPWLIVVPGIVIGLVFGAIPGLQISMAMAIFLPMTLYMDFMQAMLFLTAIFTGGGFGGSIPAISNEHTGDVVGDRDGVRRISHVPPGPGTTPRWELHWARRALV